MTTSRIVSSHLKDLAANVAAASPRRSTARPVHFHRADNFASSSSSVIPRCFSSESVETIAKKKVEDVMPIATRHEKEEIEVELEGRRLLDMDFPEGLFGTKEAPAIVKSSYDKHIMGCLGGEGRMNTTLCGSGWRKESLFNARFAHSTLS